MRIKFVTPPLSKQVGGIENAVQGLKNSLQQNEVIVFDGKDKRGQNSLHHFHGLWNRTHSKLAEKLNRASIPYVVSPHGMLEPWAFHHRRWKKAPYFRWVEKKFLANASSVFVTSEMERQHFSEVLQHKSVKVLPIGCVDQSGPDYEGARKSLDVGESEKIFLYLSRIDKKKGLDLLLQGMASSDINWEGCRFWVVGDGDPKFLANLKKFAEKKQASLPRIEWIGPIWGPDRWAYLQAADLFCLPTNSENFGIAVLEALLVGTPVLTTDQTPWADHRNIDGFFIGQPNAQSLIETMKNAAPAYHSGWSLENRNKLSSWAIENYSWQNLAPKYVEAYDEILSQTQIRNH